jgi:hypothetical protein
MSTQPQPIGLDIGTSRLVSASKAGDHFDYQTQLNAFLTLPFSKLTELALKKENVPHEAQGDGLLIYGNESERFANMFHLETRRPMSHGLLNPAEPNGTAILRQLLTTLLGEQDGRKKSLCYSVPGAPVNASHSVTYHEATVTQLLTDMGYKVATINEGLAVVLSELEATNFTGIGISCGGGMCNICLAYLSIPVFSFSILKGGDFIDESAASVSGEGATRVRAVKEQSFHFNGFYKDTLKQALTVYYDDMIQCLADALKEYLSTARNVPRLDRPVPIVISGGSSMPEGFRERFEKLLAPEHLPIAISEIRMAADPLNSTAHGALVAALAEV